MITAVQASPCGHPTCGLSSLGFARIRIGVPSKLTMPVRSRSAALFVLAAARCGDPMRLRGGSAASASPGWWSMDSEVPATTAERRILSTSADVFRPPGS
jgi:hypothetical protein